MRRIICFALLLLMIPRHSMAQKVSGVLSGAAAPTAISPIPVCTETKLYVDTVAGKVYVARGYPCTWAAIAPADLSMATYLASPPSIGATAPAKGTFLVVNNGITTATNNDNRGHVTLAAGTGTYTFTQGPGTAGVWTTAPVCIIQDDTTLANIATSTKTVTASTLTITGSVGTTDTYSYICWPGN